jgi:hypothetical protein
MRVCSPGSAIYLVSNAPVAARRMTRVDFEFNFATANLRHRHHVLHQLM